jgi:hypothetical protein
VSRLVGSEMCIRDRPYSVIQEKMIATLCNLSSHASKN